MGRVSAPFGVKGWIKLQPFTAEIGNLLAYRQWWLGRPGEWKAYALTGGHEHGRWLVAKLDGCDDREKALALRGLQVAVARESLPQLEGNEFYWTDLVGLKVKNADQEELGVVARVMETGANDVLVVQGATERLIPFIAEVIREVDIASGVIKVDWGADY